MSEEEEDRQRWGLLSAVSVAPPDPVNSRQAEPQDHTGSKNDQAWQTHFQHEFQIIIVRIIHIKAFHGLDRFMDAMDCCSETQVWTIPGWSFPAFLTLADW
ncbi:hypothetical protein HPO_18505 [Hyphomonas polymorpha PS728]|uniref:Uncharacterized protein n=1 Tax=Hyphomonas polymorpha PS728 TaxID=1280954 RepID=A0A062V9E1_9PROT|nr:hypothetical protein HPO_18505 [Hyphomonas polymorpha PS728]